MSRGVTIGQAAAFAGVTVKAVRHYHKQGLIKEPPRDASGYRRYGSAELLRLVQIKTLAAAGVSLSEIKPLLKARPEKFAAAVAGAKQRLTERIEDLVARRDMLDRLAGGDGVLLSARARKLLDRLPELGLTADQVTTVREGLVLTSALVPESFDDYLAQVERALDDRRFVELSKRSWEIAGLDPDDPRVDELAIAMVEHFLAHPALLAIFTSIPSRTDDDAARYKLVSQYGDERRPAAAKLTHLVITRLRAAGVSIPQR